MNRILNSILALWFLSLASLMASIPHEITETANLKRSAPEGSVDRPLSPNPPAKRLYPGSHVVDFTSDDLPIFFSSPVEQIDYSLFKEIFDKVCAFENASEVDSKFSINPTEVRIFFHGLSQNSLLIDSFVPVLRDVFKHLCYSKNSLQNLQLDSLSLEGCGVVLAEQKEGYVDFMAQPVVIPKFIFSMYNLTKLNLSFCNLMILPEGVGNLRNLNTLNLSGNYFVGLPLFLLDMEQLNYIYIVGNPLERLEHRQNLNFFLKYLPKTKILVTTTQVINGLAPVAKKTIMAFPTPQIIKPQNNEAPLK